MKDTANSYSQKSWEFYANQHAKAKARIVEYSEKANASGASDAFISAMLGFIARAKDEVLRCEEKFPQLKEKKQ